MKSLVKFKYLISVIVLFLVCFGLKALADAPSATISSAINKIDINQHQANVSYLLSIRNNAKVPQSFHLYIQDFGTLDESGGVAFLGVGQAGFSAKYGLAAWASIDKTDLTIDPLKAQTVKITIKNNDSLSPGGHYGAVTVESINPEAASQASKIQLNRIISSLIFLRKVGGEIYALSLKQVDFAHSLFTVPGKVKLEFYNPGNVHVTPRGVVTVKDPFGRIVKKGIINEDSGIILPETNRIYPTNLKSLALVFWPGKYQITTQFRYDDQARYLTVINNYYYLNPFFILLLLLIAVAIIYTIFKLKSKLSKS